MTDQLEIILDGRPIAWARTAAVKGRRVTPARYRKWTAEAVAQIVKQTRFRRLDKAREVIVRIDLHKEQTVVRLALVDPGDERRPGTAITGDIDNYAKAVLDALQLSGLIADDKNVTDLTVRIRKETQ